MNSTVVLTTPGWRHASQLQWFRLVAFSVGIVLGAGVVAAVAVLLSGFVPWAPAVARSVALLALVAAWVASDLPSVRFTLPQTHRQIGREVLGRPLSGPLQFGVELGTGVRTYMPSAGPYALAGLLLLFPSAPLAAVVAAGFGLGRSLGSWLRFLGGAERDEAARWSRLAPRRLAGLAAAVAVVVTVAGTLLGVWS